MKQQMAMSSLSSGKDGESRVAAILAEHNCTFTKNGAARIPDPTGTNRSGYLYPDFLADINGQEWVLEVKSNGAERGSMYHKWAWQALRHSLTGRKTLFIFNLADPKAFEPELRFLQQAIPSFNLEYVLLSDLNEWLLQKSGAQSLMAPPRTAALTTSTQPQPVSPSSCLTA